MFGGIPFRICALILTSASSAALNFRPGSGQLDPLTIHQSANITDLETLVLNGPAPHLGSSEPRCLASFGTPPLSSCQEALSFIPRNRQQVTFGQRRSIGLVDHVMPYDLISSDGLCAIRMATNVQGYNRESTTNVHLASAVDAILDTCLQKKNLGGYIAGLGVGGHLHVSVTFNIDVRPIKCFDTPSVPPTEIGCSYALNTIPVKAEKQIFGPRQNYGVDVTLPQVFRERKVDYPGCAIAINALDGQSTTASWLLWYSAANTINAMCTRKGKEGKYVAHEGIDRSAVVSLYNEYRLRK